MRYSRHIDFKSVVNPIGRFLLDLLTYYALILGAVGFIILRLGDGVPTVEIFDTSIGKKIFQNGAFRSIFLMYHSSFILIFLILSGLVLVEFMYFIMWIARCITSLLAVSKGSDSGYRHDDGHVLLRNFGRLSASDVACPRLSLSARAECLVRPTVSTLFPPPHVLRPQGRRTRGLRFRRSAECAGNLRCTRPQGSPRALHCTVSPRHRARCVQARPSCGWPRSGCPREALRAGCADHSAPGLCV